MQLIWLIVVAIMIVNAVRKQGGKPNGQNVPHQQRRPSVPNQQTKQSVPNQQARPSVPNQQARPSTPNRSGSQSRAYGNQSSRETVQQKQRELKKRLQQRYGDQRTNSYSANRSTYGNSGTMPRQNDILSRATANAMENAADKREQHVDVETGRNQVMTEGHIISGLGNSYTLTAAIDVDNPSDLMQQVNDLMITGYQADISFERDFLAEGMELLSRYEIPETLLQEMF